MPRFKFRLDSPTKAQIKKIQIRHQLLKKYKIHFNHGDHWIDRAAEMNLLHWVVDADAEDSSNVQAFYTVETHLECGLKIAVLGTAYWQHDNQDVADFMWDNMLREVKRQQFQQAVMCVSDSNEIALNRLQNFNVHFHYQNPSSLPKGIRHVCQHEKGRQIWVWRLVL